MWINEGKRCEDVDQSLVDDLNVCHSTEVIGFARVRHVAKISHRYGFLVHFIPAGSESATQTIEQFGGATLTYEYRIDDQLHATCTYGRDFAAN